MQLLAISGSGRRASTNTAMLRALSEIAQPTHQIIVFDRIADIPIFSPDLESLTLPNLVQEFVELIARSDGLIIASPEYVRSIPGGLKNAVDWLVSRDELINKPIAIMHASHRGDHMLTQLRLVLATVSANFFEDVFLRFELMKMEPVEITAFLKTPEAREHIDKFLRLFSSHLEGVESDAAVTTV